MKTTVEILKEARELIAKPGAWTQHHSARDASGHRVPVTHHRACSFCAYGAVARVAFPASSTAAAAQALDRVVDAEDWFPDFNDSRGRTQEEVVAKFDEAIAAEEALLAAA